MTPAAAIYARYSSALQHERSIEDQVALARAYAAREGFSVHAVYEDRALSGTSMAERAGLARLLADAAAARFSILIVESFDRVARDQGDSATLYKRLKFCGVEIREIHGGTLTPMNAAVRGLVGALFIEDLALKTHRGLAGRVRDGKSAGGRAYGYRPVKGEPGQLEIVAAEAEVIHRIFSAYAAGESPRAIARSLNAAAIAPPRGHKWNASTINGSAQRGNGILHNGLYAGQIVWNKVKMLKHPDTGRRISRPNPPELWQRREVPALAIIDADLWHKAQARREGRAGRAPMRFRPKHMLSGLIKCSSCGGSLVVRDRQAGRTRLECTRHRESASCASGKIFYLDRIEQAVIAELRRELEHPALIAAYLEEYNAERRRLAAGRISARASTERRLATATAEIERMVNLMVKGVLDPARHADRLHQLESEERSLKAELAQTASTNVVTLHPQALARYRLLLEDVKAAVTKGGEPMLALRDLIASVTVTPDYNLTIEGHLATLITAPLFPKRGGAMVAGVRIERSPTFWLKAAA